MLSTVTSLRRLRIVGHGNDTVGDCVTVPT